MNKLLLLSLSLVFVWCVSSANAAPALGRGSRCPAVWAFTRTGKYVRVPSLSSTCFDSTTAARRKGYKESLDILCNAVSTPTPAPTATPAVTPTAAPASFDKTGIGTSFTQTFNIHAAPAMVTLTWSGWTADAPLWISRCKVSADQSGHCTYWEDPPQQENGSATYFIDDVGQYYIKVAAPNWTLHTEYR